MLSSTGRGQGCYIRIVRGAGRGRSFCRAGGRAQLRCSGSRSQGGQQNLCPRLTATILNCRLGSGFCTPRLPELRCWYGPFTWGTPVRRAWCEASARRTLWASETRLSTKEKKKVRLYFITQVLILFPKNCSWALLVTKGRKERKKGGKKGGGGGEEGTGSWTNDDNVSWTKDYD